MFWKIYSILQRQPDVILASAVCSDPIVLDILAPVNITVAVMVTHVHGVVVTRLLENGSNIPMHRFMFSLQTFCSVDSVEAISLPFQVVGVVREVLLIRVVHLVQCGEEGLGLMRCTAGRLYRLYSEKISSMGHPQCKLTSIIQFIRHLFHLTAKHDIK